MGQKIRPNSLRLGIIEDWKARWAPDRSYKQRLMEDEVIRDIVNEKIGKAGIASIDIERTANACRVYIKAAKPGLIIGRGGQGIELLTKAIEAALAKLYRKEKIQPSASGKKVSLNLNVEELRRTDVSAAIVAQNIAWDMENRLPFRRAMKKAIENAMQNRDVKGIKVRLSGRLDGAEIARREWLAKGKLPLQTLRANIDYGEATAFTSYGTNGVKVWIYKGEVFEKEKK
jgi:small subunit ribosomal protein S3